MKTEIILSLISAVGLHAGLFCVGGGHQVRPVASAEIEVGLEAGDGAPATSVVGDAPEATDQASAEEVLPEGDGPPPPAPAVPTPAPVPQPVASPAPEPVATTQAVEDLPPAPAPSAPVETPPAPVKTEIKKVVKTGATAAKKAGKSVASRASSGGAAGGGSRVSSARYRLRAPLRYPAAAFAKHIGGTVVLTIQIDESGRAKDVSVRQGSGNRDLDAAAMQCAMASRYEPYRVNGQPEPCSVVAPFRFDPS